MLLFFAFRLAKNNMKTTLRVWWLSLYFLLLLCLCRTFRCGIFQLTGLDRQINIPKLYWHVHHTHTHTQTMHFVCVHNVYFSWQFQNILAMAFSPSFFRLLFLRSMVFCRIWLCISRFNTPMHTHDHWLTAKSFRFSSCNNVGPHPHMQILSY